MRIGYESYNKNKIAAFAFERLYADVWDLPFVRQGNICSSLFTSVVDKVLGKSKGLFSEIKAPPVPASLSKSDKL